MLDEEVASVTHARDDDKVVEQLKPAHAHTAIVFGHRAKYGRLHGQ
jgi:hypothetical protein